MAGKFEVKDDKVTVSFSWTGAIAKVQAVVDEVSEYLFVSAGWGNHGDDENPIVYSDLSNSDKLNLLFEYITEVLVNIANGWKLKKAQAVTKVLEETDKHEL